MKKRTKRKIHNRIMKNILNGKPLSKFDKKFAVTVERKTIVPETIPKATVVATFEEPSKWQKVKTKVKGWFGK